MEYCCLKGIKGIPDDEIWFIPDSNFINQFHVFDWGFYTKENKMKEKVEMPDKSTVLAVARKCPQVEEVLKGLFKEAFEEEKKEIGLKDGQIYKRQNKYFLLRLSGWDRKWDLSWLQKEHGYWASRKENDKMKNMIITHGFTLCPHATITVNENKPWSPMLPTSVKCDDC